MDVERNTKEGTTMRVIEGSTNYRGFRVRRSLGLEGFIAYSTVAMGKTLRGDSASSVYRKIDKLIREWEATKGMTYHG